MISKQCQQRPSNIIGLDNDYEAFCFDEACLYIMNKLSEENPITPNWIDNNMHEEKQDNKDVIKWLNANNKN